MHTQSRELRNTHSSHIHRSNIMVPHQQHIIIMMTDGSTGFLLELTCLKEHPQAYELGENESHLCFRVSGNYDAIRQYLSLIHISIPAALSKKW